MISGVSWSHPLHDAQYDPHVSEALTDTIIYWLREHNLISGIAPEAHSNLINIYPNPFAESISITLPEDELNGTLSVIMLSDKLFLKQIKLIFKMDPLLI
jgi:hypothetical protein